MAYKPRGRFFARFSCCGQGDSKEDAKAALSTCRVRATCQEVPGSPANRPLIPAGKPTVLWPDQSRWVSIWDRQAAFAVSPASLRPQDAGRRASTPVPADALRAVLRPPSQRDRPEASLPQPGPPSGPIDRSQTEVSWPIALLASLGRAATLIRASAPSPLRAARPVGPTRLPPGELWRPPEGPEDHRPRSHRRPARGPGRRLPPPLGHPADRAPGEALRPAGACWASRDLRLHPARRATPGCHLARTGCLLTAPCRCQRLGRPPPGPSWQPPHLAAPCRTQWLSLPPRSNPASAVRPAGLAPPRRLSPGRLAPASARRPPKAS